MWGDVCEFYFKGSVELEEFIKPARGSRAREQQGSEDDWRAIKHI
jgi:hypothetical protein